MTVLTALQSANLMLRFLLELALLTALAYGGYRLGGPTWLRLTVAVTLPLAAAVTWALTVAPRATYVLPAPYHLGVQVLLLAGAVVLLMLARRQGLALGFAAVAVANAGLMAAWGQ